MKLTLTLVYALLLFFRQHQIHVKFPTIIAKLVIEPVISLEIMHCFLLIKLLIRY